MKHFLKDTTVKGEATQTLILTARAYQTECWTGFQSPTYQEVTLFGKQILQLGAKHCNLSIIATAPLQREKWFTTPFLPILAYTHLAYVTPTGAHSSSVSTTPSSARHSRASKYSHCIIG